MEDKNYLLEAFKAFDDLNEEIFDVSINDGLEKAKEYKDEIIDEIDDSQIVIDPLAADEEEIEDTYVGKAILKCSICQSMLYKDPEEVIVDEELELANVGEPCPYCQSEDGYYVIGQVEEFCDDECEHEKDEEHESQEEDESGEDEEIEEVDVDESEDELDEAIKTRENGNLKKIRKALNSLKESSTRDKIDADADNKKERARKVFARKKDDADADRDYKLKKHGLNESDKPAAISIEDAQKWVDYDMKKYGKISNRTNRLVKKAGFQILKDDHGDYEVAAGKFESCNESKVEGPRGTFEIVEKSKDELEKDGFGYHHTFEKDGKNYDVFTKENTAVAILKEDFERVDIETDREKMSMTADENGKVTVTTEPKTEEVFEDEVEDTEEVIEPISDETKAKFKSSEEPEEIDYDFDEFEESDFDELGEGFLKKVYENVNSFKTTKGAINGNKLKLEGLITFKSGKQAKTNFVFESHRATKTGKLKFIGENKQFAKGNKSFTLSGRADGKKLVCESLTYNYRAKCPNGTSKRLYGTVRK